MPENERRKFLKASLASLAAAAGAGLTGCKPKPEEPGAMCYKPANIEPMPDEASPPESLPEETPPPEPAPATDVTDAIAANPPESGERLSDRMRAITGEDATEDSREALREQLKKLREEKSRQESIQGAMCYAW